MNRKLNSYNRVVNYCFDKGKLISYSTKLLIFFYNVKDYCFGKVEVRVIIILCNVYYIQCMASYYPHGVKLSENQKAKLARAVKNNSAITIRLSKNELTGPDQLMLTKTQMKRIQKAMRNGTGADVKISKTQIRKAVQEGGSLWSSLFSLGSRMLPLATKVASKAVPALTTGA